MTETEKQNQSNWSDGFVLFAQKLGVVISAFAVIVTGPYYGFVQTPINNLNNRIDKIEMQFKGFASNVTDLKQSVVVIEERSKNMSEDLRDIKRELKRDRE